MRAPYSGERVAPPMKLKPRRTGMSGVNGAPMATQTMAGRPMMRPSATGQTAGRMPVSAWRRAARRLRASVPTMPTTRASSTQAWAAVQSIMGSLMPRLDRKDRPGSGLKEARGAGRFWRIEVPEQQLQEDGDVADDLDVDRGELGDEPVAGQAGDAEQGAPDRGEDHADDCDLEGVEQADEEGDAVGADGGGVVDQVFADGDGGDLVEEAEAGGDVPGGEVSVGVGDEVPDDREQGGDDDHLPDQVAESRVGPAQLEGGAGRLSRGLQPWVDRGVGHWHLRWPPADPACPNLGTMAEMQPTLQ